MPETSLPRRIVWGEPAGDALTDLLETLQAKQVLLVSDPIISELPKYKQIRDALAERGFIVREYTRVPREPPIEIADEVASHARGVDAIIAVGGGSVIDAAKSGLVKAKNPSIDVRDVAPFNRLGLEASKPLLIAVPTTAGTGSDASYGIVLKGEVEGVGEVKIAVGSPEIVPYATILDPELPMNAPKHVKASSMVDALSHALEAMASTQASPLSDALALEAAKTILAYGPRAMEEADPSLWEKIHLAATMAGMAFTAAGLGLAHAIAHTLGGLLGTPHGSTVGVVTPRVVELYWSRCGECRRKYQELQLVLAEIYGVGSGKSLRETIEEFYSRIGQPLRFRDLGVAEDSYIEAVERGLEEVYHDPDIAYSPVVLDENELGRLLLELY